MAAQPNVVVSLHVPMLQELQPNVYWTCDLPANWIQLADGLRRHLDGAYCWTLLINSKPVERVGFGEERKYNGEEMYAISSFLFPEFLAADSQNPQLNVSFLEIDASIGTPIITQSFTRVVIAMLEEKRYIHSQ